MISINSIKKISIWNFLECQRIKYKLNYVKKSFDKTLFYPTMGGQACDVGTIDGREVTNVIKVGKVIIHQVK